MTPSFPEIINSRLFKFIVGERIDGLPTEFLVYEEAIAQLSKPLHTLIKGDLSEAQVGCTIWKEVGKETFERFVQFAYTGDYSIPDTTEWNKVAEPQKGETDALVRCASSSTSTALESKLEEEKPAEEHDSFDELQRSWTTDKKTKKGKKKSKNAVVVFGGWGIASPEPVTELEPEPWPSATGFHSLQCPLLALRNIHYHTCEPAAHFEPNRRDFWLIDTLKALAIYKLHKALCIFEFDSKNVADIVDLARYAYKEEGKGWEDGIGRLRGIVCQYMALHAAVLSLHAVFMDFIEEGGQFARDFVKFVVQRMQ